MTNIIVEQYTNLELHLNLFLMNVLMPCAKK